MAQVRSVSTIGEIGSYHVAVSNGEVMQCVVNEFEKQADLPGVLILEDDHLLGMIPRRKCYEVLGRPYAHELFLNRPVMDFYRTIETPLLVLPASTSVEDAVKDALNRQHERLYDPIIVCHADGKIELLDMQVLLQCQSQRLEYANRVIRSQVETGALLSNARRLEDAIEIILNAAFDTVAYDQGLIVLHRNGRWELGFSRGKDLAHSPEELQHMIHHHGDVIGLIEAESPVIISSTQQLYPFSSKSHGFKKDHSLIIYPLVQTGKVLAVMVLGRNVSVDCLAPEEERLGPFQLRDLEFLDTFANLAAAAIQNASLRQALEHMAMTDNLTRLHNRHGFYEVARRIHSRAVELQRPLSALMVDIDHFKSFNDRYGHFIGDQVLTQVAECLRAGLRGNDLLGRFGGEEFAILLPDTPLDDSVQVALRLNQAVATMHQHYGQNLHRRVTISIGAACLEQEAATLEELLEQADHSLGAAKRHGRNCVGVEKAGSMEFLFLPHNQISLS